MADTLPYCATCKKISSDEPYLKVCAKCRKTHYCSRECQKEDWKIHKKTCSQNAANASSNTSRITPHMKNLEVQIDNPFARLDNNTYLHDRSDKDVYKLLIDAFRMRQEDDYQLEGHIDTNSVYDGASNSLQGFRKFFQLASSRPSLLPTGWDLAKGNECASFGQSGDWSNLSRAIEKQDIIEHYGDQKMPMQLRMLGEIIYGRGPGGQDSKSMRQMMIAMETGEGHKGGLAMSMFSL